MATVVQAQSTTINEVQIDSLVRQYILFPFGNRKATILVVLPNLHIFIPDYRNELDIIIHRIIFYF